MFEIKDPAELPNLAAKISEALRNEYVLGYSPLNPLRDGKVPQSGLSQFKGSPYECYFRCTSLALIIVSRVIARGGESCKLLRKMKSPQLIVFWRRLSSAVTRRLQMQSGKPLDWTSYKNATSGDPNSNHRSAFETKTHFVAKNRPIISVPAKREVTTAR